MKSVVVISPLPNELSRIKDLWIRIGREVKIDFVNADRLSIGVGNKYVIVDYLCNGNELYDTSELNEYIRNNFYFYNIIYSDKAFLADFVFSSSFSKECFIDNDHGCIVSMCNLDCTLLLSIAE